MLKAFEKSLKHLATDYVDLYLIHWPSPKRGLYRDTWKALVRLQQEGRLRSIGVSNFGAGELDAIIGDTGVKPVLNQVELPGLPAKALRQEHARLGIHTQSWSPLGQGQLLTNPVLAKIAAKHGRSPRRSSAGISSRA